VPRANGPRAVIAGFVPEISEIIQATAVGGEQQEEFGMSAERPEPLDVIAVGAHPDDVEIACGGTLAQLVRLGYRVGIIDLTDGEPTPGSPGPETRLQEAVAAARILGVQVRRTLELPNRRLFDSHEARLALAKEFRRYRPSIVLGLAAKTPLASPDHFQAVQITDAAVFYSRLSKWDDQFDGLPVHTIQRQLWYSLGFSSLELPPAGGHFVMDIGETYAIKLEAIRAYQTQFPPAKDRMFRTLEGQNRYYGGSAGFDLGELFFTSGTIGTKDLVQLVRP
jgi:bacillithiol biosynthesis deacetylase BshB1